MSGCVDEDTFSPEENISVNDTDESNIDETAIMEVPLKEGYTRYSDDVLGFLIDYPDDWKLGGAGGNTVVGGVAFSAPSQNEVGSMATLGVTVFSNEKNAKWWLQDPEMYDIESLKESGALYKFENVTINGREGFETIYDPWKLLSKGSYEGPDESTVWFIVFDVDDYYYQVIAFTNNYDQYGDMLETSINSFVIDEEQMAL
jgi:hypothetical protein